MSDVLGPFRKGGLQGGAPVSAEVLSGPGAYEAFKAVDRRQHRFKIRPANRAWERVPYAYLLRIVEDGPFGTQVCLVFTFMVVVIRGRNLQPLAEAIENERCDYIYQYDPDKWEKPTDPNTPFIEAMEIHVETRVDASDKALADIEANSKARH